MFSDLISYLKALVKDWLQVVFIALEVIGAALAFGFVDEELNFLINYGVLGGIIYAVLSKGSGLILFLFAFLVANFRVYRSLKKDLDKYQSQSPTLLVKAIEFGEAYISPFDGQDVNSIHLLFDIEISNGSLWQATIQEIIITPRKTDWPLPRNIWPASQILELKTDSKTHIPYFKNFFENPDSLFVESAVNEIAPPEYKRFSDQNRKITAKIPERMTVHLKFVSVVSKKDFEDVKLDHIEAEKLNKAPFDLQVVYSFESNAGEIKKIHEQAIYVYCSPVILVLIKKFKMENPVGFPIWFNPMQEFGEIRDDRIRKELREGKLVLKNNPNLLKESDQ